MLGMPVLNNKAITIPAHDREGLVQGRCKRGRPGRPGAAETKDAEAGSRERVLLSKEYKLQKVSIW
jgi:hypothetical protein